LISKDKSIELIKWQKSGLENLLGSPSLKRRIGERVMRDYRRGEHQNPPCSLKVVPTNHYLQPYPGVEDYGLKEMITRCHQRGALFCHVGCTYSLDRKSGNQAQLTQNHFSHRGPLGAVPLERVGERWPAPRPIAGDRRS